MERYGLFVLIALGSRSSTSAFRSPGRPTTSAQLELVAVGVCFVVVCTLWWTYFDHATRPSRWRSRAAPEHVVMSRHLAYGHFGVVGGIVCIAVGFEQW